MKESNHTPEASTNIDTQGDTNLTQPSGEQPTSVERRIGQILGDRVAFEHHHYFRAKKVRKRLKALIAEERRQAKIELLEELNDPALPTLLVIYNRLKELRGENNE